MAKTAPNTIPWDTKASGLYMINTLSKHEAEQQGYTDSLMLDHEGNVAEATGANVFFKDKNGEDRLQILFHGIQKHQAYI